MVLREVILNIKTNIKRIKEKCIQMSGNLFQINQEWFESFLYLRLAYNTKCFLPCLQKNWTTTLSLGVLTDIWHRSTLRSMEVKHRKRGKIDFKTNRHVSDRREHYHMCLLCPEKTLWVTDTPSWEVCSWLIHCPAPILIPGCSAGRTAARRGSRRMQSEQSSLLSGPA